MKAAISKGVLPDPAIDPATASAEGLEVNIEGSVEKALEKIAGDALLTVPVGPAAAR
jgi:hypothetical protein